MHYNFFDTILRENQRTNVFAASELNVFHMYIFSQVLILGFNIANFCINSISHSTLHGLPARFKDCEHWKTCHKFKKKTV